MEDFASYLSGLGNWTKFWSFVHCSPNLESVRANKFLKSHWAARNKKFLSVHVTSLVMGCRRRGVWKKPCTSLHFSSILQRKTHQLVHTKWWLFHQRSKHNLDQYMQTHCIFQLPIKNMLGHTALQWNEKIYPSKQKHLHPWILESKVVVVDNSLSGKHSNSLKR